MELQRVAPVEKPTDSPEAAAIWRALVTEARQHPWMWRFLTSRGAEILERIVANYRNLLALSRQRRRALLRRAGVGLAGAALLLSLGSAPVFADNIAVDGTCTLVDAITAANTNTTVNNCTHSGATGADTITLQSNVTLTAANNTKTDYGDNGLPVVTSEITIDGAGFTISRDGGAPNFRILEVSASGTLTVTNATISGGHPQTETVGPGGTYINPSYGGAIWNAGTLALVNATITGNTGSSGGGVYNQAGTVTLTNSTLSSNTGYDGAGLDNQAGTVTVQNSTISNNTGGGSGGGIRTYNGNLTVVNSTISGNSANVYGGGLALNGPATITGSTISGNSTSAGQPGAGGGGISTSSTLILTNSTLSGNNSAWYGGGLLVANFPAAGTATLNHTTVTGNSTFNSGGGIHNNGTLQLNHTLISGNTSTGTEAEVFAGGTITVDNENLIGHSGLTNAQAYSGFTRGTTDITATSDGTNSTALASILNTTLADNGGPTMTHALVSGSPAINAIASGSRMARSGDAMAAPPSTCTGGTSYDQRGVFRANGTTTGSNCDIGSFEYGQAPTAVTIASFSSQTAWGSGPQLAWETGSESGLSGFHIWLGTATAAQTRLTDALIGAAGGLNGGEYTWQDSVAFGWGERVWYWLEAVNADGSSAFTGPVEVWGLGKLFLPAIGR